MISGLVLSFLFAAGSCAAGKSSPFLSFDASALYRF
jgi:hypothetical protein